MNQLADRLQQIRTAALEALENITNQVELEEIRVRYFGRKGEYTTAMRGMGKLLPEERPAIGKLSNQVRTQLMETIESVATDLAQQKREQQLLAEQIDITLPGRSAQVGKKHPITQTLEIITYIFHGMGFQVAEGPEVELEYYNFDALNTPPEHPARDLQDTFYISEGVVLRTHTSPVQIRVMEKQQPPIRIIAPGRVYRRDYDISHTPMFHQVEGLLVDRNVSFSELKGVLYSFARQMFGQQTEVRFRPHFFPFTEPSAEVDISCPFCQKGCRTCSGTGWIEILGAGVVDPNVFRSVGYDPEQYTGFAFGMGVDRIAMIKFGITDLRLMLENDMRFAEQF
ncbi:MAG: phenylalanine--tRNA ligase subunit alpha [Candidatus Poribacteria bacterium]|jgi:phenylalanyl-tRNA synthetase alpha chain|nr:phenylalanine--tRNA ligase subunit alpha [Candidatus Poribacteria bacterium]MDP6747117.1 phenylalanine--tRNA ligase subunit alpha [Candidatus Poribacteria bacterium]MDP6996424.1 phenylalanine--tRNA ligase subunit alpha [Candidatus Poribacteria bacterium]